MKSAPRQVVPNEPEGAPQVPDSFESAMTELDGLVEQMESGSLSLEDSLVAYKRGAELVQYCQRTLSQVQQQVKILEAGLVKPLDLGADDNA